MPPDPAAEVQISRRPLPVVVPGAVQLVLRDAGQVPALLLLPAHHRALFGAVQAAVAAGIARSSSVKKGDR